MQKLNFPCTDWGGLVALISAPQKTRISFSRQKLQFFLIKTSHFSSYVDEKILYFMLQIMVSRADKIIINDIFELYD